MSSESKTSTPSFATRVIHVGSEPDSVTGAVAVPISLSSTFAQTTPGVTTGSDSINSLGRGFEYSRTGNPTRGAFERCVASAEGAKYGVAFSSGMAATSSLIHLLSTGDHVIVIDDVYGGTQRFFRRTAKPTYNIDFSFVDLSKEGAMEGAMTEKTKLLWIETPTNPTLKMADISALATKAHELGLLVVVDNTFMSPYFQNPLSLGADIVLHSVTKFINGHSDVVMGVVATSNDEVYDKLRFIQNGMGAVPSPFDSYMALRGMKTLHVRMREHAKNAQAVAEMLESHPAVEKVHYPGLPSHPQHELAKRQMKGFGGMVTFWLKGDLSSSHRFLKALRLITLAESLGAVESLAECPAIMTHASVPEEKRRELGISDTLIRLSVGIEGQSDVLADVRQALEASQAE